MNLVVTVDHRFSRTPDGAMWTMTSFTYPFWTRYLSVFDQVKVVARVRDVSAVPSNCTRCDGPDVSFLPVPYYHGPVQYLRRVQQVRHAVRAAVHPQDAVLLRILGQVSSALQPFLRRTGHPYAVEVVGDPYDAFAPGYVSHPLRPFLRWYFPRQMRRVCAGACAAAYVSESALQHRYPPAPGAFTTHYSSIVLSDQAILSVPRPPRPDRRTFTLVIVGTLDNLSKGPDTLIEAAAACVRQGLDLNVRLVGGGRYQAQLADRAAELGIGERLHFVGWVPSGEGVRAQLDHADLFVLPSRQEGVSRATIEAMARALPCITSSVGGMPELLPAEDMVPCNDVPALARKIREVLADPQRLARMSARNLERSRDYHLHALQKRWSALYRHLQESTQAWLQADGHG